MAEFNRAELRKIFSAAEIEVPKDVLGQLCDLHTDATDGMADSMKELKAKLKTAEKERDEAKAKAPKEGEETIARSKYDELEQQFNDYKAEQTAKESRGAKESAVKAFFESKNIVGSNLDIAMLAASNLVDGLELEDGKIKDSKALEELATGKLASLATVQQQKGANTQNPPGNNGGGEVTKDAFQKMTYRQRVELYNSNKELYDKLNE